MSPLAEKAVLSPFDAGFEAALACVTPLRERIERPLFEAIGGVLAEDLLCTRALPPFSNSAMDGYGVRLADAGRCVPIAATFLAGEPVAGFTLPEGQACKVMTGSIIPAGVEAVVPFEKAEARGEAVCLPERIKAGDHIRPAGEEVKRGEVLLKAGSVIGGAQMALLASQGISEVKLIRPLRAAILSTGSEIVEPWEKAADHQVHNSNGAAIYGILKTLGAEVEYLGALHDSPETLNRALGDLARYDLLITSGGVSTGEADFTDRVLRDAGLKVAVQSMALKPGKNMMIGTLGHTVIIGLPGNPQAAMTLMTLVGGSLAAKLQGRAHYYPATALAQMGQSLKLKDDRAHIILGRLEKGRFYAIDEYRYGSGMLTPLARSTCFAIVREGTDKLKEDALIRVVWPLSFSDEADFFAL